MGPISDFFLFLPAPGFTLAGLLLLFPFPFMRRWKLGIALFCVQLFILIVTYWNPTPGEIDVVEHVRAMTFNVQRGLHHGPEEIARAILRQNPDFIFLQESSGVDSRSGFQGELRRLLGNYYSFSSGQITVCSRWPIVRQKSFDLPAFPKDRPLLQVDIENPATKIRLLCAHVAATHFTSYFDGSFDKIVESRKRQVELILARVRASPYPVILGADLNMGPWHREYKRLTLVELRDSCAGPFANATFTIPAALPLKKLDFILFKGWSAATSWVPNEDVSDHEPLVADIFGKLY